MCPALAQSGEPEQRIHQVVVGRELDAIGARDRQGFAQCALALGSKRREAPAEGVLVRIHEQLLSGLGVFHDHQTDVGQGHLERIVEPHGEDVVTLTEQG